MSKRDRKIRKDRRRERRVERKGERAARAARRGNQDRADRIGGRADRVEGKRDNNLVWDRVLVEQNKYQATEAELIDLRKAIDMARDQARDVRQYVDRLRNANEADRPAIWKRQAEAHFGANPDAADYRRFIRRTTRIYEALLTHELFISVRENKDWYGKAAPTVFNRPLSKNVRFCVDLPGHAGDVNELADTIIHEIAHTLDVVTNEPGNSTTGKALRDPDTYAAFFAF